MRVRYLLGVPAGVVLLAWGWSADPRRAAESQPPKLYGVTPPVARPVASASCAAAACHGSGKPGQPGGEYSTWAPDLSDDRPPDPHAQAYRVLFSDAAVKMARAIGSAAPHREPACLKCHSVEQVAPASAATEGVGCGACHGASDKWLAEHYRSAWAALSHRDKWERYGFVPTKNLTARVLTCVGCHVGGAGREVDHDLIAAGHPRLAFEAARFHVLASYRKHWTERTPQPAFELRLWVIGQAAGLRGAADLLRIRAERSASGGSAPWPEFAGYSCYSCHRPVGGQPSTVERPTPTDRSGWERWSTATVTVAAAHTPDLFPGCAIPTLKAVHELEKVMAERAPRPEAVRKAATAAVAELDGWLAALQAAEDAGGERTTPGAGADLLRALAASALADDRRSLRDTDWDFLAAHTLGCSAVVHASGGPDGLPALGRPVQGLIELLRFPPPAHGRSLRSPKTIDSDDREQVRDLFRALSAPATRTEGK